MARAGGLRRLTASEHQIQCAFMDLVRRHRPQHRDLKFLRAFPNGGLRPFQINSKGKRYSIVAQRMHAEGVEPGPLDIILPTRRGDRVGFWFEFKVPGKRMTPEQMEYASYLAGQGWLTGTWFDAETAFSEVLKYLNND